MRKKFMSALHLTGTATAAWPTAPETSYDIACSRIARGQGSMGSVLDFQWLTQLSAWLASAVPSSSEVVREIIKGAIVTGALALLGAVGLWLRMLFTKRAAVGNGRPTRSTSRTVVATPATVDYPVDFADRLEVHRAEAIRRGAGPDRSRSVALFRIADECGWDEAQLLNAHYQRMYSGDEYNDPARVSYACCRLTNRSGSKFGLRQWDSAKFHQASRALDAWLRSKR